MKVKNASPLLTHFVVTFLTSTVSIAGLQKMLVRLLPILTTFLVFIQLGDAKMPTCSCSCCKGSSCNPTDQGSFSVASCLGRDCSNECRAKYPQVCPNEREAGSIDSLCLLDGTPMIIALCVILSFIAITVIVGLIWTKRSRR